MFSSPARAEKVFHLKVEYYKTRSRAEICLVDKFPSVGGANSQSQQWRRFISQLQRNVVCDYEQTSDFINSVYPARVSLCAEALRPRVNLQSLVRP